METLKEYLTNYKIHLIDPRRVNLDEFSGDWRIIMEILRLQSDKQKMKEYLNTKENEIENMNEKSQRALLAMLGKKELSRQKKGEFKVCTAIKEMMEECREEGRQQGIQQERARADAEYQRAQKAEKEVERLKEELRKLLEKSNR